MKKFSNGTFAMHGCMIPLQQMPIIVLIQSPPHRKTFPKLGSVLKKIYFILTHSIPAIFSNVHFPLAQYNRKTKFPLARFIVLLHSTIYLENMFTTPVISILSNSVTTVNPYHPMSPIALYLRHTLLLDKSFDADIFTYK